MTSRTATDEPQSKLGLGEDEEDNDNLNDEYAMAMEDDDDDDDDASSSSSSFSPLVSHEDYKERGNGLYRTKGGCAFARFFSVLFSSPFPPRAIVVVVLFVVAVS